MVPRSETAMTARAPPRPERGRGGAVDRIDGDVGRRGRAVPDALAVEEHGGVVLLPLADDDDAVHGDRLEDDPHGLDGGTVGAFLVAPAHPSSGGHGRCFSHPDEFHGQVTVRCPGVRRHDLTLTRSVPSHFTLAAAIPAFGGRPRHHPRCAAAFVASHAVAAEVGWLP